MLRNAVALLCCTIFWGVGTASAESTKISFLYTPTSAHVALYVARDAGIFAKNGLDLDLVLTANGSVIAAALVADSSQMGAPTTTVFLEANEQGLDLVAVSAPEAYPSPTKTGLLVQSDSPIKTARDLAGKKVGVPGIGGILDVLGRRWIAVNGGDPKKITFVEVSIPTLGDSLKTGQVDAITTVDPFMQRTLDAKVGVMLGDIDSIVPAGTYVVVYTATRAWAEKHRDAVAAFQKSMADAAAYLKDPGNLPAAQESIARYTKLPVQVVANLPLPKTYVSVPHPDGLKFMIDLSREEGLIKSAPDPQSLIAH